MKVQLKDVERELTKLWEEDRATSHSSRSELSTLVALVSEPSLLDRARKVLSEVATSYPCRTIAVVWRPGDAPKLDAEVYLHKNAGRKNQACGDGIVLEAVGNARDWIPGNVERLLLPDLPACVWWVGDLPDNDDLFDVMVRRADAVMVNSAEMDLRDIEKLALILRQSKDSYAFMDLAWVRLRALQDLVARFFDDPTTRPYLDTLRDVTVAFSPRENETDVASTRAALLVGWMASALGIDGANAKWTKKNPGGDLVVAREGRGDVTFHFVHDKREGVDHGGVTRVVMLCDAEGGKKARFAIERQADDAKVMLSTYETPDLSPPPQAFRLERHHEATLLLSCLERPMKDRLLEASLRTATKLVHPIAPRLSERPPSLG
jgi:glucose-6-phosphate dehydrogenase assembly protein OpcA